MKKPLLFAHRGFSGYYPENSPIAFRAALEKTAADGIESDVHITKDGKLVIFHDATVNRTSNGSGYTRTTLLRRCCSWTSSTTSGAPTPTICIPASNY